MSGDERGLVLRTEQKEVIEPQSGLTKPKEES